MYFDKLKLEILSVSDENQNIEAGSREMETSKSRELFKAQKLSMKLRHLSVFKLLKVCSCKLSNSQPLENFPRLPRLLIEKANSSNLSATSQLDCLDIRRIKYHLYMKHSKTKNTEEAI